MVELEEEVNEIMSVNNQILFMNEILFLILSRNT